MPRNTKDIWDVDRYCLQCGYNLRGARNNVCPECGTPYSPGDRRTYRLPGQVHPARSILAKQRIAYAITGLLCLALPSVAALHLLGRAFHPNPTPSPLDDYSLCCCLCYGFGIPVWIPLATAMLLQAIAPKGWPNAFRPIGLGVLISFFGVSIPWTIVGGIDALLFFALGPGVIVVALGGFGGLLHHHLKH